MTHDPEGSATCIRPAHSVEQNRLSTLQPPQDTSFLQSDSSDPNKMEINQSVVGKECAVQEVKHFLDPGGLTTIDPKEEDPAKICLQISTFHPYRCQGGGFQMPLKLSTNLSLVKNEGDDQCNANGVDATEITKAYRTLFRIILEAGGANSLGGLQISGRQFKGRDRLCILQAWKFELLEASNSKKIETIEFLDCDDFYGERDMGEVMLCQSFVSNPEAMQHVGSFAFWGLGLCSPHASRSILESLGSCMMSDHCNLEYVYLSRTRYIDSWSKDGSVRRETKEERVSLEPWVVDCRTPQNTTLKELHLSGNALDLQSFVSFIDCTLPRLVRLENLQLRDTDLDAKSLIHLFDALKQGRLPQLRIIDLSHNRACSQPSVLHAICSALECNFSLHKLVLEHCDIGVQEVRDILAPKLPSFRGLRSLQLGGNTFAVTSPGFTRVTDFSRRYGKNFVMDPDCPGGVYHALRKNYEPYSVGARMLVSALKENTRLLDLGIGELVPCRVCCTSPSYSTPTLGGLEDDYKLFLQRNRKLYEANRASQMQQAVVRLASMLVQKYDLERE